MAYDLVVPAVTIPAGITILAAIYLGSKDPGRRRRAWRLLKLLLGKAIR